MFKDLAKILKLKYLGPLVQHVQVIDGQQTKRNTWQPDENTIPEQPASWPPWQRPTYWCLIEKQSTGDTRTHHIFRSVSELLERGTAACHIELCDYQTLAKSMGYVFLGTEITLHDGKVVSNEHILNDILTDKDVFGSNLVCPSETDVQCFWVDDSDDKIVQRLSYHFLHCKRGSSMPTILGLSAFLQASSNPSTAEVEARRIFAGKCTSLMFEDLLKNSKVHTLLMKSIVRRSAARVNEDRDSAENPEEQEIDNEETTSTTQAKFALRQQYCLRSHIVPATITDKIPTNHGSMKQKLQHYNSSIRSLADEGRWLVFDQFLVRVEKHFETCVVDRHATDLKMKFRYTCTAAVERDLYELLPLPDQFRKIIQQPKDLQDDHRMCCLKEFLLQACKQHNIEVGNALEESGSWDERAERFLRLSSVLSLCLLCSHWEQQNCINHSTYNIRRLSSFSSEERRLSLTPLHQNMCAHCLNLLGKGIGQETCAAKPLLTNGSQCSLYEQPPGLFFRRPEVLSHDCPEVFSLTENDDGEPRIQLQPRWQEKPPWVADLKEGTWAYCSLCLQLAQKKRSTRMPKRNRRELNNTRFYVDRNPSLFHDVLSDPAMMSTEEINHFEKMFMAHERAMRVAERKREEILSTQKQFSDPDEMYEALKRNEHAFGPAKPPVGACVHPDAMDPETIQELCTGFHEPSPIIPSYLQQDSPHGKEYWKGILVTSYEKDLLEDAPPNIPFRKLRSKESIAAVSMVKLHSHFKKTRRVAAGAGKQQVLSTFGHVSGNLQAKPRFPFEDAGINGVVIMTDERREKDLHLKTAEFKYVQACNDWLQKNNVISRVYKNNWDQFQKEMSSCQLPTSMLPVADSAELTLANSIRASTALGENEVMVATVDWSQYKGQYSTLAQKLNEIGSAETRISHAAHGAGAAAQNMDKLTQVSVRDVNLDAKTFSPLYKFGSGSLNSIEKCVDGNTYAKQHMHDVSPEFRNNELWVTLQQDRKLKESLRRYNNFVGKPEAKAKAKQVLNKTKRFTRNHGKRILKDVAEKGTRRQRAYYAHNFGTEVSRNIVGSNQYFRSNRRNLLTIIRPENQGPPNGMVTYVCNHQAAEILAMIRGGPFAIPSVWDDRLAPQFRSTTLKQKMPNTFEHSAIVAMSYQKRRNAFRARAMRRGSYDTLIGVLTQDIRRTEEQKIEIYTIICHTTANPAQINAVVHHVTVSAIPNANFLKI